MRSQKGAMVPLASLISFSINAEPAALNQYQQLNAATISGSMKPGFTVYDGLNFLTRHLTAKYSKDFGIGYKGESRQLMQQSNTMGYTFIFAIIMIFLVLAAQFFSF